MPSFGENLRRERELRGISLPEIAQATKISVRFLQALESDRLDVLPGGIFRRSFVKAYADYVGLDPDRMVSEFLSAHSDTSAKAAEPAAPGAPRASRPLYRRLFFGLIVAIATASAIWMAHSHQAVVAPPAPAAVLAPSLVFPQDHLVPSASAASVSSAPAPAAAVVAEPASSVDGPLVLTLAAQESCWVGVEVDGHIALSRVLNSGETRTLKANEQIVLSVGDAGALAVRINDRPGLALGRRGEVRRNIVITKENLTSLVEDASPRRASHSG
jgi:cytoskeletal protein RodZ